MCIQNNNNTHSKEYIQKTHWTHIKHWNVCGERVMETGYRYFWK